MIVLLVAGRDARDAYCEELSALGYHVVTASSGGEALLRLSGLSHPVVLVIDAALGVAHVAAVTRVLDREEALRSVPVVAFTTAHLPCTTAATDDDRQAEVPHLPVDLIAMIDELLNAHGRELEGAGRRGVVH